MAVRVEEAPRMIGPLAGVGDADARGRGDLRTRRARREMNAFALDEIDRVVLPRDAERARQSARSVGAHAVGDVEDGIDATHEDGVTLPFGETHDVEAVVHP